jgi:hypothetical protein
MTGTPMANPAQSLNQIVEAIEAAIRAGAKLVNWIIDRVNDFLDWLPGFIANRVGPWLDRLRVAVEGFFTKVLAVLKGIAFPVFAFMKAAEWSDKVGKPVSTVAGQVSEAKLHVSDYWQGPAADAYANALTAQTTAYEEVGSIVSELQIRLWAVAGLMVGFYGALAAVIVSWVGVLTGSAAATATGVGAVVGVPVAVADTGVSAAAIIALIAAFLALAGTEVETLTALNGRITASAAFPDGSWPTAASAGTLMNDGSMSDADGNSEWKLNQ